MFFRLEQTRCGLKSKTRILNNAGCNELNEGKRRMRAFIKDQKDSATMVTLMVCHVQREIIPDQILRFFANKTLSIGRLYTGIFGEIHRYIVEN